jgi:TonB family protein
MRASDAQAQHLAATFYEEKVRKDGALSPGDRARYIQAGLAAEDRALALTPDYLDALVIKNILLRRQASLETNPSTQAQLIAEADQLRTRAIEIQKSRQLIDSQNRPSAVPASGATRAMPPPPPPPPPPPGSGPLVDGMAPVRVGGNIKVPTKLRNVPPVYPPEAKDAGVAGVVIVEVTVGTDGLVRDTRVLRSIPMLDAAAVEAVSQWQFTPTVVNDQPVPVIMTVTVNFTLQ